MQDDSTTGIFFDVKKDFSHVSFDGLLFKPTTMGLNRKLIRWIINFFNQLNNNQLNDPITSIYGIPQGRPPFPIPFIFYVNGICQPIDAQVNLSQFLGDIVIWVQAASIRSVNFSLEKILEPTNWKTLKKTNWAICSKGRLLVIHQLQCMASH